MTQILINGKDKLLRLLVLPTLQRNNITTRIIYRSLYNIHDNINTFTEKFNAPLLQQYHCNSTVGLHIIVNVLLKIPRVRIYKDYFGNILSAGYLSTMTIKLEEGITHDLKFIHNK